MSQRFAERSKQRASMGSSTKQRIKKQIVAYYRTLYDATYGQQRFALFWWSLFSPPFTYAKAATYGIAMLILSTWVYAGVNPGWFERTATAVKKTVQAAVQAGVSTLLPWTQPTRSSHDNLPEEPNQIFCDGEWRNPEDCEAKEREVEGSGSSEHTLDIREDGDEVFCDGERRDPEDCEKRTIKKQEQQIRSPKDIREEKHEADDRRDENSLDIREDDHEVFCDGERRDPEDCEKRVQKNEKEYEKEYEEIAKWLDEEENESDQEYSDSEANRDDIREDDDEIFCDGERRDPEDCEKRLVKDYDEDKNERDNQEEEDDQDDRSHEDDRWDTNERDEDND